MNKEQLRQEALDLLENITKTERSNIERRLEDHLATSSAWKQATMIGMTVSGGVEWDTGTLIEKGWQEDKKICVPKCYPSEKKLQFYKFDDYQQLETGFYNLSEPNPEKTVKIDKNEIDLLIVPGLIFDRRGYRIGFGGGYYDRFLCDFANQTVSLASSMQLRGEIPTNEYDIPVNQIITEKGIMTAGH